MGPPPRLTPPALQGINEAPAEVLRSARRAVAAPERVEPPLLALRREQHERFFGIVLGPERGYPRRRRERPDPDRAARYRGGGRVRHDPGARAHRPRNQEGPDPVSRGHPILLHGALLRNLREEPALTAARQHAPCRHEVEGRCARSPF